MPNHCRWTLKPEFGEVPQYLVKNKQQVAEEKARVEEHLRLRQQQVRLCHVQQECGVSWVLNADYMCRCCVDVWLFQQRASRQAVLRGRNVRDVWPYSE